jgi:hypothetical protein
MRAFDRVERPRRRAPPPLAARGARARFTRLLLSASCTTHGFINACMYG